MKKILKILLISIISLFSIFWFKTIFAQSSNIQIPWENSLSKISINYQTDWDLVNTANATWFKLLMIFKIVLQGLLLIFIVYAWGQMIMSMWDNEEQLSSSKRQLWYWVIALVFINIPWTLYQAFKKENYWKIDWKINNWWFVNDNLDGNIFLNPQVFWYTFEDNIIWFFKVVIYASAILMFILAAYKIMMAKWNEEEVTKSKKYFFYAVIGLIFAWIIDVWKYFIFNWSIKQGINLFEKLWNIALFFAWPVAIIFLTLAWYYYITSNGDEEKVKKSKSIIINTILWVLILLASYTFLLDLANL
jgi:NADH:ubiquinone oxidoreductase subunit 6 (subunit J)